MSKELFNVFNAEEMLIDGLSEDITDGINVVDSGVSEAGQAFISVQVLEGSRGKATQDALPDHVEMNGERIEIIVVPSAGLN